MSGHSKWSTIKRQKEANDASRGKLFSKLSKAISIAAKAGGGGDPDTNYKLRMAIETARNANMPKANIERAISKAGEEAQNLEEVTYEGFGPFGTNVVVEAATDNRNRTSQEIKNAFERAGGSLGGPGAVSFNFEAKGMASVKKNKNNEDEMLTLIELGAEDIEEDEEFFYVYTNQKDLSEVVNKCKEKGFVVEGSELVKKPKTTKVLKEEEKEKVYAFLERLEEMDDVQSVFANISENAEQ